MTVEEVEARVEKIRAIAFDSEEAHAMEDELWEDVLEAVAGQDDDSPNIAAAALKTREIEFERWYA